jgi:hypothetical protein
MLPNRRNRLVALSPIVRNEIDRKQHFIAREDRPALYLAVLINDASTHTIEQFTATDLRLEDA